MDTDWTRLEAVEDYSPIVHRSYGLGVADDVIDWGPVSVETDWTRLEAMANVKDYRG